ncbi:MAG: ATP-grasp domain-containing protein [Oscillospiraceae bacterium]|nr:ATP-grasp domain-containing protein [Oscillospiraceae bacterium]
MTKVAIIGAADFQCPLILKAKSLGYETHVFAWEEGAVGKAYADYFYPISIAEKEQILEVCRRIQPQAVCSIGSDLAVITVKYVSEALHLNGNSAATSLQCTNKYEMRKTLQAGGLPCPGFFVAVKAADLKQAEQLTYPLIVKPTDRSGSRGITKVANKEELAAAFAVATDYAFSHSAIIEEYIDGDEYSCESISFDGRHHFLALTKKYTTGAPHFIETGHMQPSDIPAAMQPDVVNIIHKALTVLGIKNSASHAEFKITSAGELRIIEIGARMGGDCIGSNLVEISTGKDFVKMVLDVALGKAPDLTVQHAPKVAAIQFVFTQADLQQLAYIKQTAPQALVLQTAMQPIGSHKIVDSGTRYGHYILACESVQQACTLCGVSVNV